LLLLILLIHMTKCATTIINVLHIDKFDFFSNVIHNVQGGMFRLEDTNFIVLYASQGDYTVIVHLFDPHTKIFTKFYNHMENS